ncbi:MAG: DUF4197 domain-containing protein [Candidatus Omnitrophica bacterium]|nr:DUF4197 domain-containing protein [Candidatus Omnitrophota bacterium]
MKKSIVALVAIFFVVTNPLVAEARFDWFKNKVKAIAGEQTETLTSGKLSDSKIGQGLKEALKVGITNAVEKVSQTDGYLNNENIKLLLPDKLQKLEKGLRMVGFDEQLDEFILSMNRAAESAAPQARDIFLDSLFDMSIDDAQKIYRGKPTAATDYFRKTAYDRLHKAFQPSVEDSLRKYDVTAKYKVLLDKYATLPFTKNFPAPDIDDYVVGKSLDGLFEVLGQEEQKIRTDPAARVTDLLREVFK